MRGIVIVIVALAACSNGGSKDSPAPRAADASAPAARVAPALTGTLVGTPFAPTVVLLLESSDGGALGFYQLPDDRRALPRARCAEPMPTTGARQLTKYLPIVDWKVGVPLESAIDDWGVTDVGFGEPHPGRVRVTLTDKDAAKLHVAGTIELASDDGQWKLAGPFEGDYCPTKVVVRGEDATLAGTAWTQEAVDPATISAAPVQAIMAGVPAAIAHATWREVTRYDAGAAVRRQELLLFAGTPANPCALRPSGEHAERIDTIAVWTVAAPAASATLAGRLDARDVKQIDQISEADLSVFEPDGTRGWRYSQYFTAALAIDAVDDQQVRGRVFVAVPDQGKSMAVGAFTARRCPPGE